MSLLAAEVRTLPGSALFGGLVRSPLPHVELLDPVSDDVMLASPITARAAEVVLLEQARDSDERVLLQLCTCARARPLNNDLEVAAAGRRTPARGFSVTYLHPEQAFRTVSTWPQRGVSYEASYEEDVVHRPPPRPAEPPDRWRVARASVVEGFKSSELPSGGRATVSDRQPPSQIAVMRGALD